MKYPSQIPELSFDGKQIRRDGDFWNLTDMWKAAGSPKHQKVAEWTRLTDVRRFTAAVEQQYHDDLKETSATNEKVENTHLFPDAIRTQPGRSGGTWAHWQIALAYTKYLSPAFAMWAGEIVRAYLNADPNMVEDMFNRMSVPDQKRTLERLEGIKVRRRFTDILKDHGVIRAGYAQVTEALQMPILGMPTAAAKAVRGVPAKTSVREVMSTQELSMTRMAEEAAADRIAGRNVTGNNACASEATRAGRIVRSAYDQIVNGD
jgi:hypothetical protein